jgi:sugar lactone lactonase YvrE
VGSPATTDGFYNYPIRIAFDSTQARNVFAWDITRPEGPQGRPVITGKRNIFQSLEGAPDGMKSAANGHLIVASALTPGVDVLDASGNLIMRIQTTHAVENINFSGSDFKTLWLVGIGGITKVEWDLAGPDPNNYFLVNGSYGG